MSITLTHPDDGPLSLPPDMQWADEFDWTPVATESDYTLTGALVIQSGLKLAGRPITLLGGDDACWLSRADVAVLHAWAGEADLVLTLDLHGDTHHVRFDHAQRPIEAREVFRLADPGTDHPYTITIRLIEVPAP